MGVEVEKEMRREVEIGKTVMGRGPWGRNVSRHCLWLYSWASVPSLQS